MKQYWTGLPIRKRLLLSLPLLLVALVLLWAALGWPLTVRLTLQMVERESGLLPGEVVAEGVLNTPVGSRHTRRFYWAVSRCGDRFAGVSLDGPFSTRTWGSMRNLYGVGIMQTTPEMPLGCIHLVSGFVWNLYQKNEDGSFENYRGDDVRDSYHGSEEVMVVCSTDPEIVRVELTQAWLPASGQGTAAYLEENGSTIWCEETAPGSGIWLGRQVLLLPDAVGVAGAFGPVSYRVRGYGADGALRCERSST